MTGDPYRSGIFFWTRRSSKRCSSKTSAKVLKVKGKSTTRQATAARVVASALGVTFGVHQKLLLNAAWQGSGVWIYQGSTGVVSFGGLRAVNPIRKSFLAFISARDIENDKQSTYLLVA
jgi:hypothetical protein